jgi:signal peptidase I
MSAPAPESPSPRRVGRIVRIAAVIAITGTLLFPMALWALGARLLVVDGGSMAPTYAVGDVLVVTAPTDADLVEGAALVVGTGAERYVHRVVEVDGDRARLRGDANEVTDPGWVDASAISGVVALHLGRPAGPLVAAAASLEGRIALVLALFLVLLLPVAWRPRAATAPDPARATFTPVPATRKVSRP